MPRPTSPRPAPRAQQSDEDGNLVAKSLTPRTLRHILRGDTAIPFRPASSPPQVIPAISAIASTPTTQVGAVAHRTPPFVQPESGTDRHPLVIDLRSLQSSSPTSIIVASKRHGKTPAPASRSEKSQPTTEPTLLGLGLTAANALEAYNSTFAEIAEIVKESMEDPATRTNTSEFFNIARMMMNKKEIEHGLACFLPRKWINDLALELVLAKLTMRDKTMTAVPSILSSSIVYHKDELVGVKKDRFLQCHGDKELYLIPINLSNTHWVLMEWRVGCYVRYHDSLSSESGFDAACKFFAALRELLFPGYKTETPKQMPCYRQPNGYDCGLHVMRQVDIITAGGNPNIPTPPTEERALRSYYRAVFLVGNEH